MNIAQPNSALLPFLLRFLFTHRNISNLWKVQQFLSNFWKTWKSWKYYLGPSIHRNWFRCQSSYRNVFLESCWCIRPICREQNQYHYRLPFIYLQIKKFYVFLHWLNFNRLLPRSTKIHQNFINFLISCLKKLGRKQNKCLQYSRNLSCFNASSIRSSDQSFYGRASGVLSFTTNDFD